MWTDSVSNDNAQYNEKSETHTTGSKNGYGAPVNKQTGKFTKQESEVVKKAIAIYCSAKGISTARLCAECDHKAELKGAWMEISKS